MADILTPNKDYTAPGTYIGERFSAGSPNVNPQTRVATYVGRGSRYIRTKDQTIRRGFIYDAQLTFSKTAPHVAALSPVSNGSQTNASLIDSKGTEIRTDLWLFTSGNTAIQIADSVYDPTETYFFSYQSSDTTIPDPIPTSDIRVIEAVGSQISQDSYKRNVDYFIDTSILNPTAAVDANGQVIHHSASAPVFGSVVHVGTGTGVVAVDTSAMYNHNYSRDYKFTVSNVAGTVVTLSWTATPTEFGNASLPSVPVAKGITAPTLSFDTTNEQSLTLDVELGIRITVSTGTYVVGDTYSLGVTGPSLIEVDSAMTNTNQFAASSAIVLGENNTGTGSVVVNADAYALPTNTKFVMHVTNVDTGVTVANVPSGTVTFTDNPNDSEALVISNGQLGSLNVTKTFEFSSDAIQSITGSVLVPMGYVAATAATGSIGFSGTISQAPNDGDTITLTDGVRTQVFEFDIDGVLNNAAAIRVLVSSTAGQQSMKTAANLVTAINASSLTITATDLSSTNSNIGLLGLTHGTLGSIGNNTILTSRPSFILVSGFSGGTNVGSNLDTTVTGFVNAVNNSYPRLGIVAVKDVNNTKVVDLIYGARFTFTANPATADTVTVTLGDASSVFEFNSIGAAAPGHIEVINTGTLAVTMANFISALSLSTLNLIGASSVAGGLNTVTVASALKRSLTVAVSSTVITGTGDIVAVGGYNNGNKAITTHAGITNVVFTGMAGGLGAGDAPDILTLAWGTAGDVFAGGTLSINESTADKTSVPLYGGVTLKLSKPLATYAKGSIELDAVPADGDTVTLNDKTPGFVPVVFTFKNTPSGAHDVQRVAGNTATTAANLRAKIRASTLAFSIPTSEVGSVVTLTHNRTGSAYNGTSGSHAIETSSTSITVHDMLGGGNNYSVGDSFAFTALAPRKFPTALDTRTVRLSVGTVGLNTPALVDPDYVLLSYSSNTPEGGFGTIEAYGANKGYVTLPGQIALVVRNATSLVTGDVFDVQFVNNNVIYWTLDKKSTEVVTSSSVLQDRNGAITGNAGAFYVVLRNQPYAGTLTGVDASGVAFTGFTVLTGTSLVLLPIKSASEITSIAFSYTHKGSEPSVGSMYYLTAQYIRPASMYNNPQVFYDRASARSFLEPVTLSNDLAIANEIAFDQAPKPNAVAFIQVRDGDDDGVFSPTDIDTAIASALGVSFITDITPVNLSNYSDKFQAYNINANDPFEKKEHLMYFGLPIGTNVGSELEEGSIVFTAKRTLQVYGASPAHGTRILVAPTMAKKKITYSDGSVVTATLDGSFVAAAICAKIAGMPDNASDILRQNIYGFDYVETFNDTTNNIIGASSTIYFRPNGTGVYQIMEDVTVDTQASHYNLILAMKTKHDSVRVMRRELDNRLIGFVADTKAAGVGFVQANVLSILLGQVGSGLIAPFQDESGNVRIPNESDVLVKQDISDPTLYHFVYGIFTRTVVKRLFGVYTVNESTLTGSL